MNLHKLHFNFFINRKSKERRKTNFELPYLSEEGIVLYDRRQNTDRRLPEEEILAKVA